MSLNKKVKILYMGKEIDHEDLPEPEAVALDDYFAPVTLSPLATEMVWDNVEHIFCDNEPFSQQILKKHWPTAPIYGDIRTLTNIRSEEQRRLSSSEWKAIPETWENGIDLITGGFPCQPFSQAGRRKGTQDDRFLWPEMLRVIREFRPRWVIAENVAGLLTIERGVVFEQVCADLEGEGYAVQAFVIPAVAVNAPHRRDRVWIVARDTNSNRRTGGDTKINSTETRQSPQRDTTRRYSTNVTDTSSKRRRQGSAHTGRLREGTRAVGQKERHRLADDGGNSGWREKWTEVATRLCRVDDGLPRRLDRTSRLKGLGNAIVPQVAAEVMRAIKEIDL